ncbi:hypothetical protein SAMD00019534_017260, partial [Acytostelium subglobosum LB1]|uniref:hypothetical protein n=1 Tax=Acytostelium subglobosum LB1 TaxID=1410327 RepID=UPI00064492E5
PCLHGCLSVSAHASNVNSATQSVLFFSLLSRPCTDRSRSSATSFTPLSPLSLSLSPSSGTTINLPARRDDSFIR